jgi:hypothetical protein
MKRSDQSYFCMISKPEGGQQQHNGALLTLSTILCMVVASAAEAEMEALFLNAKEGVNIRNILREMGHPHSATPLHTDNTAAHAILRGTCKQQRVILISRYPNAIGIPTKSGRRTAAKAQT